MIVDLISAAEEAAPPGFLDLSTIVSGGAGATLMAAAIFIVKLILDRTVPSRSDARANITLVLEGLNNMVKVLQDEKTSDAKRLEDKRARIEYLEAAADKDYDKIAELRAEIVDLRKRLAVKDRNITVLVSELKRLGSSVSGLDLEDIKISPTTGSTPTVKEA